MDVGLLAPIAGAITAIPVVTVFAVGFALGGAREAVTMAIGANLIAVISLVGAPRLSIRLALFDVVAMGLSALVGTITGPYAWLHTLVLIPWCFGAGMLVALGQSQATVGTQAIIAFVVLGRFSASPLDALQLSLFISTGALVEVVALLVLRLPPSFRFQRHRLSAAFEALAELARRDPNLPSIDVAARLDEAERALAAPSLLARADVGDLRAALDQARRIRLELMTLAGLRTRRMVRDPSVQASMGSSLEAAAAALTAIAALLRHPRHPPDGEPTADAYSASLARLEETWERTESSTATVDRQCLNYLAALGGQIRAAANLVGTTRTHDTRHAWRLPGAHPGGGDRAQLPGDLAVVRGNLRRDSPAFRHAVRLALAVPLSLLLATSLSLPRSYWVPFSVAVILKPDYSSLFGRGLGRVIGTLVGALVAAVLVSELHPDLLLTTVLVALTAWAAYSTWAASFSVAIGFVTALVLILLSTSLTDTVGTAVDRFVDVVLGGAIAVVAYLVWPTSARPREGEARSALFGALGHYLDLVFDVLEGEPVEPARLSACSRATRLAWARAETAVVQSAHEPAAARSDPSEGQGQLAVAQRIVRALHALRIDAERGATVPGGDELEALRRGFLQVLDILVDGSVSGPLGPVPELRPLYGAAQHRLAELDAPPSIGLHLDELVNALDTGAHLAGLETANRQ